MHVAEEPLPAPPVRERTVLPVVAVVLVLAVVVFGGYVTAGALSSRTGAAVDLAGLARVTPLSGWEPAGRSSDPSGVRLTRGSGTLDVFAGSFADAADDLMREYVVESLERQAEQLSVSQVEAVELASGLRGVRVSYVGTFRDVPVPIEGEVTAVVSESGVGVIFDGWAPSGQLQSVRDDVRTMIETAELA